MGNKSQVRLTKLNSSVASLKGRLGKKMVNYREGMEREIARGMRRVWEESLIRAPHDTSTLKNSGYLDTRQSIGSKEFKASVSYSVVYAAYQHEYHKSKSHFLKIPFDNFIRRFPSILGNLFNRMRGIK